MKVSLESGKTLELLANICGNRRVFAEIFTQATGIKSGYQTLTNAIRAHKGMSPKHMESFLHNLHHAEGDNNLVDYKDDLRYMYYLLDYLVEAGIIDRDESMRIDALSPKEERQIERRFGDGYEPKGDGNVEGLSDEFERVDAVVGSDDTFDDSGSGGDDDEIADITVSVDNVNFHSDKIILDKEEEMVNVEEQEETTQEKNDDADVDDILSQLLAFGGKQDDTTREEDNNTENVERPSDKGNSFLDNFLGGQSKPSVRPSVSSDGFDSDLADVPDVFDKDSKKF